MAPSSIVSWFATSVVKEPSAPSAETSIRYPVTGRPPVSAGALQARPIRVSPFAVATSPIGAPGVVGAWVEPLTTAGTSFSPVVKLAASWPAVSWRAASSLSGLGSV